MQYHITRQNEGFPLLSRIIEDVVKDNYAMGLLATEDVYAMTVIGSDEELSQEYIRINIRMTEDEDFIQTISVIDLDEGPQQKAFMESALGQGFIVDDAFPNMLNCEMPAGQFIDGMFIESILRQVFNLKDDSAIFATTSLE
jgi:hypothetical protein